MITLRSLLKMFICWSLTNLAIVGAGNVDMRDEMVFYVMYIHPYDGDTSYLHHQLVLVILNLFYFIHICCILMITPIMNLVNSETVWDCSNARAWDTKLRWAPLGMWWAQRMYEQTRCNQLISFFMHQSITAFLSQSPTGDCLNLKALYSLSLVWT